VSTTAALADGCLRAPSRQGVFSPPPVPSTAAASNRQVHVSSVKSVQAEVGVDGPAFLRGPRGASYSMPSRDLPSASRRSFPPVPLHGRKSFLCLASLKFARAEHFFQ